MSTPLPTTGNGSRRASPHLRFLCTLVRGSWGR